MGPSGSGKSTLMHCMAGLDTATEGTSTIGDTELSGLSDKEITALRRDRLGFVFQSFNLVPTLTAEENITLPVDIAGRKVDREWFDSITSRLGLTERLSHRPSELSGGQQQRVACARALVGRPEIIFGDEPTELQGRRALQGLDPPLQLRQPGLALPQRGLQPSELLVRLRLPPDRGLLPGGGVPSGGGVVTHSGTS